MCSQNSSWGVFFRNYFLAKVWYVACMKLQALSLSRVMLFVHSSKFCMLLPTNDTGNVQRVLRFFSFFSYKFFVVMSVR